MFDPNLHMSSPFVDSDPICCQDPKKRCWGVNHFSRVCLRTGSQSGFKRCLETWNKTRFFLLSILNTIVPHSCHLDNFRKIWWFQHFPSCFPNLVFVPQNGPRSAPDQIRKSISEWRMLTESIKTLETSAPHRATLIVYQHRNQGLTCIIRSDPSLWLPKERRTLKKTP